MHTVRTVAVLEATPSLLRGQRFPRDVTHFNRDVSHPTIISRLWCPIRTFGFGRFRLTVDCCDAFVTSMFKNPKPIFRRLRGADDNERRNAINNKPIAIILSRSQAATPPTEGTGGRLQRSVLNECIFFSLSRYRRYTQLTITNRRFQSVARYSFKREDARERPDGGTPT